MTKESEEDNNYEWQPDDVCGEGDFKLSPKHWATPACKRHDIGHLIGGPRKNKLRNDKLFWEDLKTIIKFRGLSKLRYIEGYLMYLTGINFGSLYWQKKNRLDEILKRLK